MAKIKWRDMEIVADTTYDVIILLDKLVTYQKIMEVNTDALLNCQECKSFDLVMTSPNQIDCQVCGAIHEYVFDENQVNIVKLEENIEEIDEEEEN
jgi:hypothetical protein